MGSRAKRTATIRVLAGLALVVALSFGSFVQAQDRAPIEVSYTLNPARVLNHIDEKIYGHFFEHIYHSANGGLWGELIWNRSFEENSAGRWTIENGEVIQAGMGTDQRVMFGDPAWTNYEFTLEAQKTGGSEGFLILFRETSPRAHYWYNIGGWSNVRHQLEKARPGRGRGAVGPAVRGRIETGKWYPIRVRCQGNHIQIWLDGEPVLDYTDERSPNLRGRVGVGTWATTAKFRKLKVTDLNGKVLFEGLPPAVEQTFAARHWSLWGSAKASIEDDDPLNSNFYVHLQSDGGTGGLSQDALCVRAGETYLGSLWVRGSAPDGLAVRLISGDRSLAQQELSVPGSDWSEMSFKLRPTVSDANATLQIVSQGKADLGIDQVSMMPRSWKAQGGFRPDLVRAVGQLKPPIIRWPGGCFASPYRWKDGIGPQYQRGVTLRELWDDLDINSLGTDEFIALCRKVGAEPLIVINIGTPQWNADADTHDFLQDALDWVEYCNGPADSKWGKVRAANGHPEPYHVKYWEIDNETWAMGADNYIAAIKRFAPALRKADPSIKLAACGSNRYDLTWNRRVIEGAGELFDYISIHSYENPDRYADGPYNYERFIRQTGDIIAQSRNPQMKIYCSEWNAQSTDWRTGLYAGGVLNAFERCGDVFEIAGPALFLRHVSATAWDNAFINFDQSSWFPAPNYVVMQLWRNHYAPNRIEMTGGSEALNAIATKSEDGKTVYVKCVNPGASAAKVVLKLTDEFAAKTARMQIVAPGSLEARNSLERPRTVRVEPGEVRFDRGAMRLTLPALSATVVTIRL